MLFVNNSKSGDIAARDMIKELTKDFIEYSVTDFKLLEPCEYKLIDSSVRRMRDLYRHSLCRALELPSQPAFTDIPNAYALYYKRMCKFTKSFVKRNSAYKRGVLQLGVNSIVRITQKKEGM